MIGHVLKDTLYEDQKLIDILNMSSGDQNHVTERDGLKKIWKVV